MIRIFLCNHINKITFFFNYFFFNFIIYKLLCKILFDISNDFQNISKKVKITYERWFHPLDSILDRN